MSVLHSIIFFISKITVGIVIWFRIDFPAGLVAGDEVVTSLSIEDDDLIGNMTVQVPLEIPAEVSGVTLGSPSEFTLTVLDNEGTCTCVKKSRFFLSIR